MRMILFHLSYISDKEHSKAVRGWLIIPTLFSHLDKAAEVPGTVSTAPHHSSPRVPSMIKRSFTTNLLWKGLTRPEERRGGRNQHTFVFPLAKQVHGWASRRWNLSSAQTLQAGMPNDFLVGGTALSIQRTRFVLLTSHIAVTTRRAIPLLSVLPMKKLKGYFWNKGAEAAELQGKTPRNNPLLYRGKDPEKHWLPCF